MIVDRLILDTDVLIDALREYPPAKAYVETVIATAAVAALTAVELWVGARGAHEEKKLHDLLDSIFVLEADRAITRRACEIGCKYHRSHGVGAVDAMIAATAESVGATLVTLNKKHFPMLKDVLVPYKK